MSESFCGIQLMSTLDRALFGNPELLLMHVCEKKFVSSIHWPLIGDNAQVAYTQDTSISFFHLANRTLAVQVMHHLV
jgi:hypothetical protein